MKKLISNSPVVNAGLLCCLAVLNILLSPKWFITPALWLVGVVAIRYFRNVKWQGFLIAWVVLALSSMVAQYEVIPMPLEAMVPFMLIANLLALIPFVIDKLLYKRFSPGLATLVFPLFSTLFTYLMDQGPAGTWGNPIYTQYHFSSFIQLLSLTGIYGLYFIIMWFASVSNYLIELKTLNRSYLALPLGYVCMLIAVVLYGETKLNNENLENEGTAVSTVTLDNTEVMKAMYEGTFNKTIELPKYISNSSPEMAEINKGLLAFMENPEQVKYKKVYQAMDNVLSKYFEASKLEVAKGAKVITWSEAAIIDLKNKESVYRELAAEFADKHDVFLFFPTAVFHPEKVGKEGKFIENKVLAFNPQGDLVNEYFKNIPVFGIEPSFPGDGNISPINTAYGKLASAICYDLDFPELIRQAGEKKVDLLVVPTGDWKAIAPYHTYMGAFRCIENGTNMIKAVSNGLSAVIDHRGEILSSNSFFDGEPTHSVNQTVSLKGVDTIYGSNGDYVIVLFSIMFISMMLYLVGLWLYAIKRGRESMIQIA